MSQTTPPPAAIRKLRIRATVGTAYGIVFRHLAQVVKAAALPFALVLAIGLVTITMGQQNGFLQVLLMFLGFVPYTIFGVAWHRFTLLGPDRAPALTVPAWRRRHWRFFGYAVAMQVIAQLTAVTAVPFMEPLLGNATELTAGAAVAVIAIVLVALSIPYVIARLSFVFPAAAVDERYGLIHSWAHTKGQGVRLMLTLLLAAVPLGLGVSTIGGIVGFLLLGDAMPLGDASGGPTAEELTAYVADNLGSLMLLHALTTALYFLLLAVMVSVVSVAFRDVTGWVPADEAGLPVPRGSE